MNMGGINLIHQRESKDIKKAKAIEQEFAYSSYNSVMDSIEKGDLDSCRPVGSNLSSNHLLCTASV